MEKNSKLYIAGHQGMVGSAIHLKLKNLGYWNFILRTSAELDLRDQSSVQYFFESEKPDYVFLAAAKFGGIHANEMHRAEFIYDNLMIHTNIIHQCYRADVAKLLVISSSFVYPVNSEPPIKEDVLFKGELEPAYSFYGISKIATIKMCQAYNQQYGCKFNNVISCDIYGENAKYDQQDAHVFPALLQRIFDAKMKKQDSVEVWGNGTVQREFIHASDLADACIFLMNCDDGPEICNVGTGESISIQELADLIKGDIGYSGHLYFNPAKPDVMGPGFLDTSEINKLGWFPQIQLHTGVDEICRAYEHDRQQLSAMVR